MIADRPGAISGLVSAASFWDIGTPLEYWRTARRFIESILFGLSAADPLTYGSVAGVVIAVALPASLVPALRAARVDPMTALRAE